MIRRPEPELIELAAACRQYCKFDYADLLRQKQAEGIDTTNVDKALRLVRIIKGGKT